MPTDTVRLNATTIEQLFKDTNYNLKDIRKTKLVKPIALTLLPEEMKMIESISTSGKIEEDTKEELKKAITDFNKTFIKTKETVTNENN